MFCLGHLEMVYAALHRQQTVTGTAHCLHSSTDTPGQTAWLGSGVCRLKHCSYYRIRPLIYGRLNALPVEMEGMLG